MIQNINDLLANDGGSDEQEKLTEKLEEIKNDELEEKIKQIAQSSNLQYINLKGFPISQEALSFIDEAKAKSLSIVCFALLDKDVKIATTDPENPQLKKFIREIEDSGKVVEFFLCSELSLSYAIKLYDNLPKFISIKRGLNITKEDLEKYKQEGLTFDKLESLIQKVDTSDIISALISSSVQIDASDIHIEAQKDDIQIRFRIDGVLHKVTTLKSEIWSRIIARIKLLSGLKINITAKPQDGRFTINFEDNSVDVRVSTIPTNFGESVVMRLLRSSNIGLDFDALGIRGKSFVDIKKQIDRPNGMIITTGPTGSGKTTTLYSILTKLNSPEKKIITLEDPVEYKLKGINQSQIDKNVDYNFAMGLRSILRQDPDVVMVGEIRDLETAEIAINAALTGH
ncbi:MAG TPA: ATPase, T2SS/T4P/T4SS family, partial [bacterium]|nr:ATPase, T2SS/T4P/T4SS family [bacterium]